MISIELGKDLEDILTKEIENVSKVAPICPFLRGPAGSGKSSYIKDLCIKHKWWFFELLCQHLGDRTDITGGRTVKTEEKVGDKVEEIWKQVFFPHQEIQDAITCAKNHPDDIVVLFLDEINRVSSDITSAILAFTTARKIGSYKFPDNVRFIVAGNEKGHIVNMDEASLTRFAIFNIYPSATTFFDVHADLNPYIRQVLTENPSYIVCKNSAVTSSSIENEDGEEEIVEYKSFDDGEEGECQMTCPRTLSGINAFLNSCDKNTLAYYISRTMTDANTGEESNLLKVIVDAHIGDTVFANNLITVIANDIVNKSNTQNNIIVPLKPAIYDQILTQPDRQSRENYISTLSKDDISASILYAVWEKNKDNKEIIEALAKTYPDSIFIGDQQPQFANLKMHDELDVDNYTALINSNTGLGNMMKTILGD